MNTKSINIQPNEARLLKNLYKMYLHAQARVDKVLLTHYDDPVSDEQRGYAVRAFKELERVKDRIKEIVPHCVLRGRIGEETFPVFCYTILGVNYTLYPYDPETDQTRVTYNATEYTKDKIREQHLDRPLESFLFVYVGPRFRIFDYVIDF